MESKEMPSLGMLMQVQLDKVAKSSFVWMSYWSLKVVVGGSKSNEVKLWQMHYF